MKKRLCIAITILCMAFTVWACPAFAMEQDLSEAAFSVTVKVSGPNTKISWPKVEGAKSYRIWRSSSKHGIKKVLKKKTTKRSFIDKKGKSGKVYYYHVRAYNVGSHSPVCTSKKFRTVYRVYVETGHGTGDNGVWDPGCCWKSYQEAKLMIPIAKATARHLKENGIYVYTDAYDGNNRNLNYTLDFLDSHSVSVFLNIHCDASFEDAGTLPLYRTAAQKKLATALNKGVHKYVEIKNRGLEHRSDLKTLNSKKVHCPACLFETGNIKKDNRTLRRKTDEYGKGFAKGICDYLELDFAEGDEKE